MNKYKNGGIGSKEDAIYSSPYVECDSDNIFIIALPHPLTDEKEIYKHYSRSLSNYNESQRNLEYRQRRFLVSQLKNGLRIPMPFDKSLENEFYNALVNSYRCRMLGTTVLNGVSKIASVPNTCASNSGFSFLGHSGVGKSAAIDLLLSRYPQVIIHKNVNDEIKEFNQITYLYVQCYTNSNFDALYNSIGEAIDNALGTEFYEDLVRRSRGIGAKTTMIAKLIKAFGIGAIIIDEIQLIDFSSNKDNTYESLLTLNNLTKVAIIVVGTEHAYNKLLNQYRTRRRSGINIMAESYCGDKEYYKFILSRLFKYQWFNHPVKLTNDIVEVFYNETKGIIDQTISLYEFVHDEYLANEKDVEITSEYIRKVSSKYFPGIKDLLNSEENQLVSKQIADLSSQANEKYLKNIEMIAQKKNAASLLETANKLDLEERLNTVVFKLKDLFDYSEEEIMEHARKLLENNLELNDGELARLTMKSLKERKHKSKKGMFTPTDILKSNLNLKD